MRQTAPKVFISYSHDSKEHSNNVLVFTNKLRVDGIDAILDQFEEFGPPDGWPFWMTKQIRDSDFVIIICTQLYYARSMGDKSPGKSRRVRWESLLTFQQIYDADSTNERFLPVLFDNGNPEHIPDLLRPFNHYYLRDENGYDKLYRRLTNQPEGKKEPLGKLIQLSPKNRQQEFIFTLKLKQCATMNQWLIRGLHNPDEGIAIIEHDELRAKSFYKFRSITFLFICILSAGILGRFFIFGILGLEQGNQTVLGQDFQGMHAHLWRVISAFLRSIVFIPVVGLLAVTIRTFPNGTVYEPPVKSVASWAMLLAAVFGISAEISIGGLVEGTTKGVAKGLFYGLVVWLISWKGFPFKTLCSRFIIAMIVGICLGFIDWISNGIEGLIAVGVGVFFILVGFLPKLFSALDPV